jgi:hypothetical protein
MQAPAPLNADQLAALNDGRQRWVSIERAAKVAAFNGWTIGFIALVSVPFSIFSLSGLVMCGVLGFIAWRELAGQAAIKRMQLGALRSLAFNQLFLVAVLVVYSAYSIWAGLTQPSELSKYPELQQLVPGIEQLEKQLVLAVYVSLAVITALVQGGCAWWYNRRERELEAFVRDTPTWVIEILRAAN